MIARKPEQVSAELEGEVVILSIDNGRYYNMNVVGSRIWALVEQPISMAALVDYLVEEFAVERTVCEEDVLTFLGQLQADGLVEISEP